MNLRIIGLALVVVSATCGVTASAASAANGRLTATGPVTLDMTEIAGEPNGHTAFNGKTECPGSVHTGHKVNTTPQAFIPSGAETMTVTPDLNQSTCSVTESGVTHKATDLLNECDYVWHIGETIGVDRYNLTMDIVCAPNKSIIESVYFSISNENIKVCETTIGPQTGLTGASITDNTNGTASIHGTFTGVIESKSGTCGSGSTTTGEWHFNLLAKGTNESGGSTSISLSHL